MAVAWFTLCFRLGSLPLLQPDEGRNAEVAREMKASGAWLVPTYDGVDYLDKPAFYFKAVAFSLAAFGDNETAARLPSALFGLGLVALTFAFCRKVHGLRCAAIAATVIATMPLFIMLARTVIFDMALAFFVCAAIFAGYLAEETDGPARRKWYCLGAAAAGLATLVKGPVGFVVPGLVLLIFNRVEGRRGAWRRLLSPLNFLIFFAVTLPWFVGLCWVHPDFVQYGLVDETFHRFVTAKTFHRSEPFYFYLIIVAATFFPWSLLLPEAGLAAWREGWAKQHRADRLCLIWSVVVVIFFSISQSKLPGYILSATVACGILVARLFGAAWTDPASRAAALIRRATRAFAVVCLLLAGTATGGLARMRSLAGPLRIPPDDAARLAHAAIPLVIALAVFGLFGLTAGYRRSVQLCFLCLTLFIAIGANAGLSVIGVIFDAKSGRSVADNLAPLPANAELACLECFPNGLPFYLRRTATLISRTGGELTSNYIIYALKEDRTWPRQIVSPTNLSAWLADRTNPVYLVARQSNTNLESIAAARGATIHPLGGGYRVAWLPAPGGS